MLEIAGRGIEQHCSGHEQDHIGQFDIEDHEAGLAFELLRPSDRPMNGGNGRTWSWDSEPASKLIWRYTTRIGNSPNELLARVQKPQIVRDERIVGLAI